MVRAWSTAIAFVLLIHIYTSLQFPATSKVTRNVTRFKRKITTQPDGRIFNYILNDNAQNDESISKNLHTSERKGFYGTTQQTEVLAKTQEDGSHTGAMTKTIHTRNKRIKKRDTETHMTPKGGNGSFIETGNSEGKTGGTTVQQRISSSNAQESNGTLEITLSSAPKTFNTEANRSAAKNIPGSESTLTILLRNSRNTGITERTTVFSTTNEANFSLSTSNNETRISHLIDNITMTEASVSITNSKENNGTPAAKFNDISNTTFTTLTKNYTTDSDTQEKTGSTSISLHSTLQLDQNSSNGTDGNSSVSNELYQNKNVSNSLTITTDTSSSRTEGGNRSSIETANSEGKTGNITVKPEPSTSNLQKNNNTLEKTLSSFSKPSNTGTNGIDTTNIPGSESTLTNLSRTSRNEETTEGTTVLSSTNKVNFSLSTTNNETRTSDLIVNRTMTEPSVSMSNGTENNSTPAEKMSDIIVTTLTTLITNTSVSNTQEKAGSTPSSIHSTLQLDQNSSNGSNELYHNKSVSNSSTIATEISSSRTEGGNKSSIETENSEGKTGGTTVKPGTSTSNAQESNSTLERTLSSAPKMSNTEVNGSATTNIPGSESTLTILHRTSRNAEITEGTTVVSTPSKISLSISNNETRISDLIDNITMPEPSVSMSNGTENNSTPAEKMGDIIVTTLTTLTTNTSVSNTQEKTGSTPSSIHSTLQKDQISSNDADGNSSVSTELNQNENLFKSSTTTTEINVSSTKYDRDNLTTGEKSMNTALVSNTSIPTQNVTKGESSSTTSGNIVTSKSDDDISKAMGTEIPITTNLFNTDQSFHTYSESSANTEQNVTNTDNTIDTETTTDIAEAETESVATTSEIIPTMEESTTRTNKEIQTTTVTNPTTQWTTKIDCAMQQGNVTLTNFESNSTYFKIYFESSFNPDCIDEYIVEYQENNKAQLEQNIATNKTFETSGLSPCTRYRVRVDAVTAYGNFSSITTNITTENHTPGEVENLTYTLSAHTLHASWSPPITAPNCVEGYSVALTQSGTKRPQIVENVTNSNFNISDLHSCTNYTLKIKPFGVGSYGNETELIMKPTDSEAPPAPVTFTDVTLGSRWIGGTWILPDLETTKYGCGFSSLIMTCQQRDNNVEISRRFEVNRTSNQVTLELTNLEPNRQYECFSKLNNSFGLFSIRTPSFYYHTQEEVPDPPQNLKIIDVTSETIRVEWEPPTSKKANITGFNVQITCEKDRIRPNCNSSAMRCPESLRNILVNDTKLIISTTPNTQYTITVAAIAKVGTGLFYNPPMSKTTSPAAAGPVLNINVNILPSEPNSDSASIDASWESPCLTSGTFDYYLVKLKGKREQFPHHIITQNTSDTKITIKTVKYEHNYTLQVQTHYSDVQTIGVAMVHHFETNATIPASKETPENKLQMIPNENIDLSSQAVVLIKNTIFTEDTGRIMKLSLVVSTKNVTQTFGKLPAPTLESWSQTKAGEKNMYQATNDDWMPFEMMMPNGRVETQDAFYTLGNDHNCKPESEQFCNGPLNPDSEYTVLLRAQTAAGYRDLSKMYFKTAPNYKLTIILVCVFVFILVIVVSFVLIAMRRRQHGWPRKLMVTLFGMAEEAQAPRQCKPIPLEKFGAHYETVTELGPSGETRLAEEFRLLATLSPPNVVTNPAAYSTALAPDNKFKNRYINILPYDETRVKLSIVDDDPSSSYINASLIKGYSGEVEYIASQGPKLETCEDFWRMIFEHDVTVIVMVTNLTEKGKDKCHQYYPNLRETKDFCFISVKCTTEINFPVYTSRTLLVQKESLQKTVVQLHFREWPDFGCPVSTDLMLSFCQNMRHEHSRNEGIILVHCSAGVGRTGTLLAVDILLQHMREHKKLDVFGTVLKMRHQRINMVQTEGQYAYIYQCMKDALEDPSLLNSESTPSNSIDPIYANVSAVARASEAACDSPATSPSLAGSEPEHKKFISPELVTLASECSEDFPPPPDDLDEVEYENFQREQPVYENFPPPISDEKPVYENFPPPISDEHPEYKNFPIENEPEYGNFVGSLIDISSESKKLHSSSAEMNSYPMIASEDSDKETVL